MVYAGILSSITDLFTGNSSKTNRIETVQNSQNIPLLQNSVNFDLLAARGDGSIIAVNNALISENGPSGTLADISDIAKSGHISRYLVRDGDTLSGIAKMFGVSVNTIIWANDVTTKTLKAGQELIILPVSGTIHKVVKGDTLGTIAKKYKADIDEITQFNGLNKGAVLSLGDQIIIPDGEGTIGVSGSSNRTISSPKGTGGPNYVGYYLRPLIGGVKSQGLHGYNGVDIATPRGTSILASASGEVIVSRSSGWNGGYGNYIVSSHYNGTQTLYAHMGLLYVSAGDTVVKGQIIGLSGNTGRSTGPHLHFEIRGAKNPF
jgi:LysM repeat protein